MFQIDVLQVILHIQAPSPFINIYTSPNSKILQSCTIDIIIPNAHNSPFLKANHTT